jgi:hypothetical protein
MKRLVTLQQSRNTFARTIRILPAVTQVCLRLSPLHSGSNSSLIPLFPPPSDLSKLRPTMSKKIEVLSREVRITGVEGHDYVCLTDIARYKDPERTDYLIFNWLRNRNTIEFLGIWEQINNPGFNPIEFDGIKKLAGLNSFILTAKQWIGLPAQISTSM